MLNLGEGNIIYTIIDQNIRKVNWDETWKGLRGQILLHTTVYLLFTYVNIVNLLRLCPFSFQFKVDKAKFEWTCSESNRELSIKEY